MGPSPPRIPVARPQLASLADALPYLQRIDASRTYSNFGPLNALFESRLADRFGLEPGCTVTCNNATNGLTIALQHASAGSGRYCLMPAWTFAATAHAAIAAGLTPYLLDVDSATGALTPEITLAALADIPEPVDAVMPVAPFGAPMEPHAWDAFRAATGIEVVIDAAAGFDTLSVGQAPAVVSLHATKLMGIGEGGFVVCSDPATISDLRRRSNFGFDSGRRASLSGCNAKLSEMGAAYGLAALDHWPSQRRAHEAVLVAYRTRLEDIPELKLAPGLGESWVTSTFNIESPAAAIVQIEQRLALSGIQTRRWWNQGLHRHPAFTNLPRTELLVTDELAARTLGLPCFPDLAMPAMDEIAAIVREVLSA
jgi:dTDP-4-amino-4,6-dideoxygalactose transaminase